MLTSLQSYVAIPLVVLIVFLVLVAIARPDRDEKGGDGLYAVYLSVVGVTALYLMLVFGVTCIGAIAQRAIVDTRPPSQQGFDINDTSGLPTAALLGGTDETKDALIQTAVFTGLLTFGAAVVFGFHLRRRRELAGDEGFADSAAARVDRAYVAAVSFVAIVVGISALAIAGYGAFRIIAPGVTGKDSTFESQLGLAQLLAYGALVGTCIVLFRVHFWEVREVPEGLEP